MRIICEVCKQEGYLQQLGSNYFRVRHYAGKGKFFYHQQSKDYAINKLKGKVSINDQLNNSDDQTQFLGVQNSTQDGCNILKLSLDNGNTRNIVCGRRLVWFRTLAFQANDPGFKSRRPHQTTSVF